MSSATLAHQSKTPTALYPLPFVALWSTDFIGAKFGLPYAELGTVLSTRYVAVRSDWHISDADSMSARITPESITPGFDS